MSLAGYVDFLSDTCIRGWAADKGDWGRQVCVDLLVNSAKVAAVPCVEFRDDLRAAGIGDGCKAFQFNPSAYLVPGPNVLEVRHTGTQQTVSGGRGRWVRRRPGIAEPESAFLAVLDAYYDFNPRHHLCVVGTGREEVECALRHLPFRKCTVLDASREPAENVDLVVWPEFGGSPEATSVLKHLVKRWLNRPGFLVAGDGTADAGQIRRALARCGARRVWCDSIGAKLFAFAEVGGFGGTATATPVLAHIHVPKCAGTSFRVMLVKDQGARHLPLYVDDTYYVYGEETIRSYLLQNPKLLGFSSHHVRTFPRWMAGREMLYVCFLRDPVQQFVSYMTHIQKFNAVLTESLLAAVPPDAPRLTLREIARWLVTNGRDVPFRENHNVNFFTRHSAPAAPDRLEAAKAALSRFFFVGITERMEESMRKLRVLARAAGVDLPLGPLPVENVSNDYRDDLSWICEGDEAGRLLLRSVEDDRRLYDWALARFESSARPT